MKNGTYRERKHMLISKNMTVHICFVEDVADEKRIDLQYAEALAQTHVIKLIQCPSAIESESVLKTAEVTKEFSRLKCRMVTKGQYNHSSLVSLRLKKVPKQIGTVDDCSTV